VTRRNDSGLVSIHKARRDYSESLFLVFIWIDGTSHRMAEREIGCGCAETASASSLMNHDGFRASSVREGFTANIGD
jgi:hypothetical protein